MNQNSSKTEIGAQKEKEIFSFKYGFKQCRSKNGSENDLKAVTLRVLLHHEENMCGSPHNRRIRVGHK